MKRLQSDTGRDDLLRCYASRRKAIRRRLAEFARVPPSGYFYELLYCLLTPQSSAINAEKAVRILTDRAFAETGFDPEQIFRDRSHYIRFHRTKSRHVLLCREQFPEILKNLTGDAGSEEIREWLVLNVKGLGWKEASHVLRNIGHRNLAILDRHILRNLVRYGAISRLPKTLTRKNYMQIEQKFRTFSLQLGVPLDELDLLFWSMETGAILK